MITATAENREYTLFHMVNRMVWEARCNDEITRKHGEETSDLFPSTDRLLKSLTRQAPNRIYFGSNGRVSRALFFSEQGMTYQVRVETLQLDDNPRIVKSEYVVSGSPGGLEQEITWWRRQFGMPGDLLTKPLFIMESLEREGEIIHVGGVEKQVGDLVTITDLIYCRYYQSSLNGPRFIDLGVGSNYKVNVGEEFRNLGGPPSFILRHLNPFSINS